MVARYPKFIFQADLGRSPAWAFPMIADILFCVVLQPSILNSAKVVRILVPSAIVIFSPVGAP
jgi:hypothetical protein